MSAVPNTPAANDPDSLETQEWLDALEAVLDRQGPERAHFLLERLVEKARRSGAFIPFSANTAYVNTIPVQLEARSPEVLDRLHCIAPVLQADLDGTTVHHVVKLRRNVAAHLPVEPGGPLLSL